MAPSPAPASRFAQHPDPSGYVDATWWPRSGDLGTELPELITALQPASWPISRVVYDPAAWSPAPPHLVVNGGTVRLDPYTFELPETMYVYGADGIVLVVLVVPAATR
ncbi:DUF5994 family protein [Nocardia asteroides]|uniref:DUF5994 family protein n=1 Tax=Nocardia asteroides TaxID=1824 RepID=UPI001E3831C7|nr:DUF5994 family protein [Nocardia asteroides]UGT63834.1 DUF5994 family protein [Nocardia asteroides]